MHLIVFLDLGSKILDNRVQSVALAHYNHDWETLIQMCVTQLDECGKTSLAEAKNDASYGIPDFSDKNEADNFFKQFKEWQQHASKFKNETAKLSDFQYKSLQ